MKHTQTKFTFLVRMDQDALDTFWDWSPVYKGTTGSAMRWPRFGLKEGVSCARHLFIYVWALSSLQISPKAFPQENRARFHPGR